MADAAAVGLEVNATAVVESPATLADGLSPDVDERSDAAREAIRAGKQRARALLAASNVPGLDPGDTIPAPEGPVTLHRPRPTTQELLLDQYITRDHLHAAALREQAVALEDTVRAKRKEIEYYQALRRERQVNPAAVFGYGYAGYGNGHTDGKPRVLYPAQRKRPGGRRTRELRVSRADRAAQADRLEELVPVRLDVELDKVKLRDTFTWNLHERVITPEYFAEQLVEDFGLPPEQSSQLAHGVAQSLSEQIQDFYPHVFIEEDALDPHLPYHAYKDDDMRVLIKLNITIGPHTLVDQFEWDINNPLNSPEEFARQMTRDLSLSGEFTTAIAHSIREQIQLFTKSLYVTGHPFDGRPVEDADLRDAFLSSPLPSVFRSALQAKEFAPTLWELNEAELDRTENSLSREQRRQKRSVNRRGGPALPDLKDRPRTVRTLIVSSVIPGAAETQEDSRIFKRVDGAGGARTGRRPGANARAGDDSDLSDSDESDTPESPPPAASNAALYSGGTRSRGVRGAASAAQAAMRATLGRSATPELASLHHHETRTSAKRFGGRDVREDVPGDVGGAGSLIVKLKLDRSKLRQIERGRVGSTRTETPHSTTTQETRPAATGNASSSAIPQASGPGPTTNGYGGGSTRPGVAASAARTGTPQHLGAVDAAWPPQPGQPAPPPPTWLTSGIANLRRAYPHDSFDGTMRYAVVDTITGSLLPNNVLQQPPLPPQAKAQWLPRIRCNDCPGKLYTPGPGMTVENFEIHLKNRQHRERVDARTAAAY